MKFFVADLKTHVCVDTKCETTLENRQFVKIKCFNAEIHTMTILLRIREIDAITHETNEYVRILILFSDTKFEKQVLTRIIKKIHLMNEFKVDLFIENDFLKSENCTINISNKKTSIVNYDVDINLSIKQREFYVKRNTHAMKTIMISSKTKIKVSTKFSIFDDRNFVFELINEVNFILFYHIIDFYTNDIIVRNDFSNIVKGLKHFCLKFVIEMLYDDCF